MLICPDTYIETQLAPALEPGAVVIKDNLSTQKSLKSAKLLKQRKCLGWKTATEAFREELVNLR